MESVSTRKGGDDDVPSVRTESDHCNSGRRLPQLQRVRASVRPSALDLEDCLEQNRPLPDRSRRSDWAVAGLILERSLIEDHGLPSDLRTRHRAPRLRTSTPTGSSLPLDRYSTSPSGKRSRMICVPGMSQPRGDLSSPLFSSGATRSTRWPSRSLSMTFHALPRRLIVAPTDGIGLFVPTTSKSPPG